MQKCPCCGGVLQQGFARTGQRISWKKRENGLNVPKQEDGEFYLLGTGLWNGSVCPGFYCPDCDLILLPQKEDDEK